MSIRVGSGGNGKFTGGDGITRRLRFLGANDGNNFVFPQASSSKGSKRRRKMER